jgi:LAO/AO transport system kinase
MDAGTVVAGVVAREPRAIARAISLVEDGDPGAYELVRAVYPRTGKAHAIGVTGPPGVGKSTLISALVRHVRGLERTVGVVSVDPSSPFTGGAVLGDDVSLGPAGVGAARRLSVVERPAVRLERPIEVIDERPV